MKLLDLFTESKSGEEKFNEDGIFFNPPLAAVIDGTTSKEQKKYNNISSGRYATQCILSALEMVSPNLKPYNLICFLNDALKENIISNNFEFGASASVVIYNDIRRELISYGDNPYAINGVKYIKIKSLDRVAAQKRVKIIEKNMARGVSIDDIRKNDPGRKEIINFLKETSRSFANKDVPGGYPVIAGQDVIKKFLTIHKIEKGSEIILASDGYPEIKSNFKETEKNLQRLITKDILCINELKGTKCVELGNISFDDRSFLRFTT